MISCELNQNLLPSVLEYGELETQKQSVQKGTFSFCGLRQSGGWLPGIFLPLKCEDKKWEEAGPEGWAAKPNSLSKGLRTQADRLALFLCRAALTSGARQY